MVFRLLTMLSCVRMKSHLRRGAFRQSKLFFSASCELHDVASNVERLCELLRCSEESASFLVRKNKKILSFDSDRIYRVTSFCKDNLKLCDVLEYPGVMSLSPQTLNDRKSTLKELGCQVVTARTILLFDQFMQSTPSKLHWKGILTIPSTSFKHIVSQLNCPEDLKLRLISKLLELHSNESELSKIKFSLNIIYLTWKLQCSEVVVTDMLGKEASLRIKSLNCLERVSEILLDKFELPLSKVHSSPSLLTLDCDNLGKIMVGVPKICGLSIHHIVKKQPLILKRSVKSLQDITYVLESHGVTDVQLLSCTKILNFRASTVSSRLTKLASSKNAEILKTSKRYLWLIFNFKNMGKNKKIVEELGLPYSQVDLFGASGLESKERSGTHNFFVYLSEIFGKPLEAVKMEFEHNPNINLSSLQKAEKVVEYLTSKGVSKEQLWNGLGIVLYDADVVTQYLSDLPNRSEIYSPFSEWTGHLNLIQLLIYVIENDQNFTGNGVYM